MWLAAEENDICGLDAADILVLEDFEIGIKVGEFVVDLLCVCGGAVTGDEFSGDTGWEGFAFGGA